MTFVKFFKTLFSYQHLLFILVRKKDRETGYAAIDHSDIRGLVAAGQWDRRELPLSCLKDQSITAFKVLPRILLYHCCFSIHFSIQNIFYAIKLRYQTLFYLISNCDYIAVAPTIIPHTKPANSRATAVTAF